MQSERLPALEQPSITDGSLDMVDHMQAPGQPGFAVVGQRQPAPEEMPGDSPNVLHARLIDRIETTGDVASLWELASALRPPLLNIAKSIVSRYQGWLRTDAEDIVIDATIKVVRRFMKVNASGGSQYPRPQIEYFVAAMKSVINDIAKRHRLRAMELRGGLVVQTEEDDAADLNSFMDRALSAEDDCLRRERQKQAASALGSLAGSITPEQRAGLEYLFYNFDGLDLKATEGIRERYGLSPGALKAVTHRMRQKARKMRDEGAIILPE